MKTRTVAIITEVLPPAYAWDPHAPVRGTDKFYRFTAEAYKHDFGCEQVTVFYDGEFKEINGVHYVSRHLLPKIPEFDRIIVCNPRKALDFQRNKVKTLTLWTNFCMQRPLFSAWCEEIDLAEYDEALCISAHAKAIMPEDVRNFFRIVPHGVHHKLYATNNISRERRIAFTSSHDRGLELVMEIVKACNVELVKANRPTWDLFTTPYGGKSPMSDAQIAEELKKCRYWVHPGVGNELFCLAAAEAQAAGCCPIIVPNGALKDTVKWGFRALDIEGFRLILTNVLLSDATAHIKYSWPANANHIPSWADTVRYIEHEIGDRLL